MKYELKRISVWSAIKISFPLNLVMGFMVGIFYAFIIMMMASLPSSMMTGNARDAFSAITGFAIIIVPFFVSFFFAIVNTLVVAILTPVFNLIVKLVGGLELELSSLDEVVKPAMQVSTPIPVQQVQPQPRYQPPKSGDIDYSI